MDHVLAVVQLVQQVDDAFLRTCCDVAHRAALAADPEVAQKGEVNRAVDVDVVVGAFKQDVQFVVEECHSADFALNGDPADKTGTYNGSVTDGKTSKLT